MFARNSWNGEFADRVAFADLGGRQTSCTGDRLEFLGRNSGLESPASLQRVRALSGKTGAGLDPCAALQAKVELEPGESTEVVFLLGEEASRDSARSLIERYRTVDLDCALLEVSEGWDRCSGLCRSRLPIRRWISSSTAGCSIRRSPAGCGRAPRSTSPEGRTGSATSSRTSWPWRWRDPTWCANSSCGPLPGSSPRAMSSTGGTPRPAAACGPEFPTIVSGCPMRRSVISGRPTIRRSSTRRFRGSRVRSWRRVSRRRTSSPRSHAIGRRSTSTVPALSTAASRWAATACP